MNPSNKIKKILGKVLRSVNNQQKPQKEIMKFSTELTQNEHIIKEKLGSSDDILITKFNIKMNEDKELNALLVAVDGIIDEDLKRNNILKPLQTIPLDEMPNDNLDQVQNHLQVKNIELTSDVDSTLDKVLQGNILILVEGYKVGLLIKADGFEVRGIEEPKNESTVRGAEEGFIESNGVNITIIRRRVTNQNLRFESYEIGELTKTDVKIGYIKDVADPKIVQRVRDRLKEIKIDAINNDGEIEQLIEDHPYSIFPTIGNTQRPDKVASLLTEGRIILLTNGSPIVLFGPNIFLENFINIEDYISRPFYSSIIRLVRFFAFIVSIYAPALYLTALNFEKNLIPSDLVVPIIQARELVPFPLIMEVVIAVVLYEIVREAGIRLPEQVGSALSIVGALILGEVAVTAGLIGAPTIVIISISYIASFVITPITDVVAVLRIYLIIASALFGSFGIVIASLGLLMHMVSLTSFGVPYLAPFSPFYYHDWKDTFIRLPLRLMRRRPESIPSQKRMKVESVPKTGDEN